MSFLEWLARKRAGITSIEEFPCNFLISTVAFNAEFDGQIVDFSLYDKLKIIKITLTSKDPPEGDELDVLIDQGEIDTDDEEYGDLRTLINNKDLEIKLIIPHGSVRKINYKDGSYVWDIGFPKIKK